MSGAGRTVDTTKNWLHNASPFAGIVEQRIYIRILLNHQAKRVPHENDIDDGRCGAGSCSHRHHDRDAAISRKQCGANTLPGFKLSNLPETTRSIAIILHDLDVAAAYNPEDNLHWLAWNIPATVPVTQIEEGKLPEGSVNGRNGRPYMGMGAPNGPRYHHYVFEFYALNSKLDLPVTAGRAELLEAMKGKVVAKAAYVGRLRNDTNTVPPRRPRDAGGPGGASQPLPAAQ